MKSKKKLLQSSLQNEFDKTEEFLFFLDLDQLDSAPEARGKSDEMGKLLCYFRFVLGFPGREFWVSLI